MGSRVWSLDKKDETTLMVYFPFHFRAVIHENESNARGDRWRRAWRKCSNRDASCAHCRWCHHTCFYLKINGRFPCLACFRFSPRQLTSVSRKIYNYFNHFNFAKEFLPWVFGLCQTVTYIFICVALSVYSFIFFTLKRDLHYSMSFIRACATNQKRWSYKLLSN